VSKVQYKNNITSAKVYFSVNIFCNRLQYIEELRPEKLLSGHKIMF